MIPGLWFKSPNSAYRYWLHPVNVGEMYYWDFERILVKLRDKYTKTSMLTNNYKIMTPAEMIDEGLDHIIYPEDSHIIDEGF